MPGWIAETARDMTDTVELWVKAGSDGERLGGDGEDITLSYEDEIVDYVEKAFPYPSLKHLPGEADNVTADLFRIFCFFIKEVNTDPKALTNELIRIDRFLGETDTSFLTGNEIKLIDCKVLSRLHSIRIACKTLKEFEIPVDLHNLWHYMESGYNSEAFTKSCPSDQEIVMYWAERPDTPNLLSSQKRAQLCRQRPLFTFIVPKDTRKSE
ncbi:hypothetical protein QR680_001274 [Steinernema hermaphroditum]|uniref:GST C-terminal domain-containing protein n=1 Tax=Steinernema hermaphroditum TaxID=289476 RepID=A0AA39GXJ9_9BILA|nr:hypothetical protein QR680_001274 [Steinernema hermaphroditum]